MDEATPSAPPPDGSTADTVSITDARVPRPRLERGVCVGRYVIVRWLGEGGMGVVYNAYDPELERPVALKLLHAVADGGSASASERRDRLLREAKALARLSHPNVLAIHDVGTFGTEVFLATEFVDGSTLSAWLADKRRSRAEVLEVLHAAGDGLAAAHRAGLVHRDFKPANVVVGADGRVRVLDFGLARGEPGDGPVSSHGGSPRAISSRTRCSGRSRVRRRSSSGPRRSPPSPPRRAAARPAPLLRPVCSISRSPSSARSSEHPPSWRPSSSGSGPSMRAAISSASA